MRTLSYHISHWPDPQILYLQREKKLEELEAELKVLLLPRSPDDDKNVIVEIRAGAGGDSVVHPKCNGKHLACCSKVCGMVRMAS